MDAENPNNLTDPNPRDSEGWLAFTPQLGDVLIAEVDFGLDTVRLLEDPVNGHTVYEGIQSGYIGGNLQVYANAWGGDNRSRGEFWIDGDYFAGNCPPDGPRIGVLGFRPAPGQDTGGDDPTGSFDSGSLTDASSTSGDQADFKNHFDDFRQQATERSDLKFFDVLSNDFVYGSKLSGAGREMVGAYAVKAVDSNRIGEVLFDEVADDRDSAFADFGKDKLNVKLGRFA